jgi:thiamine-monophosphate kinase
MTLENNSENERIRLLLKCFHNKNSIHQNNCIVGLGAPDDAAVLQFSNSKIVISSDFIRGTQFDLFKSGHMNYFDIGYYLVVANISDIAAMGARPKFILTVIRYSKAMTNDQFSELCNGVAEACQIYQLDVIGGDTGSFTETVLSATALGESPTSNTLLRSGAAPGDLVCVTGPTGMALSCWLFYSKFRDEGKQWFSQIELNELLLSWRRPQARVEQGISLNELDLATACQDTSDGLYTTLIQIADASEVGMKIYERKLPVHSLVSKFSEFTNIPCNQLIFGTSVDFQLVFTLPEEKLTKCIDAFDKIGESFIVIGEITSDNANYLVTSEDKLEVLPAFTWDQSQDYLERLLRTSGAVQ